MVAKIISVVKTGDLEVPIERSDGSSPLHAFEAWSVTLDRGGRQRTRLALVSTWSGGDRAVSLFWSDCKVAQDGRPYPFIDPIGQCEVELEAAILAAIDQVR